MSNILNESGQPIAQLSLLIRPVACAKTQHAMDRWDRAILIPQMVAFYHKGSRWLCSSPQATGAV